MLLFQTGQLSSTVCQWKIWKLCLLLLLWWSTNFQSHSVKCLLCNVQTFSNYIVTVHIIFEPSCYQHLPKSHKAASCELLQFVSQYFTRTLKSTRIIWQIRMNTTQGWWSIHTSLVYWTAQSDKFAVALTVCRILKRYEPAF